MFKMRNQMNTTGYVRGEVVTITYRKNVTLSHWDLQIGYTFIDFEFMPHSLSHTIPGRRRRQGTGRSRPAKKHENIEIKVLTEFLEINVLGESQRVTHLLQ